jgi:hypothetical protein
MVWKLSKFFFPSVSVKQRSVGKKEYKEVEKRKTTLNDLLRLISQADCDTIDCRLYSSIHNSLIETENKEKELEGEKEVLEVNRPPTGINVAQLSTKS